MVSSLLLSVLLLATPAQSLPVDQLIVRQAQEHLPPQAIGLKVLRLKLPPDLPRRVDPDKVQVYFKPQERFSGATLIRLDLPDRHQWVSADLELLVAATVARQPLTRGHVLCAEDLEVAPLPRRALNGAASEPLERLIGGILTAPLQKGDPVLGRLVKRPLVVKRGDRVEVVVESADLVVQTAGFAQSDGRVGDTISVRALSSDTRFQAEIASAGRVRIQLSGSDTRGSP